MATETVLVPAQVKVEQSIRGFPPFPDDIPTAPLLRVSLKNLLDGVEEESNRLFQASKDLGFFYLDVTGTPIGGSILKDVDQLFDLGEQLFDLDLEEKQRYDFSSEKSYFGYKGYGQAIVDREGTRDRNEFYNVSKDDILSISPPLPAPALLIQSRPLLSTYIHSAHSILTTLLTHLNSALHLPASTLPNLHRLTAPSGDQVRLLKAPPQDPHDSQAALGAHTDFGSLTLLFNRVGGLQVLPPTSSTSASTASSTTTRTTGGEWLYVRPLPGHAIVNLGDAMSKFTHGLLRSNIHRVVAAPGLQSTVAKYSVVYFSRPEDDVLLRRLDGGDVIPEFAAGEVEEEPINSKEWVLRRALGRRVGGDVRNGWMGTEST